MLQMHKETGKIYYCTICSKGFTTSRQFSQHTSKLHKKLFCANCGIKINSSSAMKNHQKSARCAPRLPIDQDPLMINPDDPPIAVMEF